MSERWHYKVVELGKSSPNMGAMALLGAAALFMRSTGKDSLESTLNSMGAQGWELVQLVPAQMPSMAIFKRPS